MSTPNHTLTLNDGKEMPLVGHGLWKIPNEKVADHVYNAIKAGYRLFDSACDYGNEVEAGQGVARAIKDGLVKREDLFIVSKLWNTFHERERVEPICRKQLKDFGLEYFDLYIMHFPIALKYVDPEVRYPPAWFHDGITPTDIQLSNATIRETWEAMESLVDTGLVRSLGISNFNCCAILDLLRYARIRPATLQIEHHPYLVQQPLVDFATKEGITITAYSSFGPQGYVEMDLEHAVKTPHLFQNPVVNEVAKAHGKTAPQVLLRWATQQGIAVIPKSDTLPMLLDNLNAKGFDLTGEEIKKISALNRNLRFNNPLVYFGCLPIFD
ncbi:D-xylose reductase [Leptodontidium sp. 2 PMI_412]|nr:D-xylose reductase [Leptodontidium sp. 2 PMI_412]